MKSTSTRPRSRKRARTDESGRVRALTRPCPSLPHLPSLGWSIDSYGYVIYSSRRKLAPGASFRRGSKLHRLTILHLLQTSPAPHLPTELTPEWDIHHQDFNKLNNCPSNLILLPRAFNPSPSQSRRDPFTQRFSVPQLDFPSFSYEELERSPWLRPFRDEERDPS